MADLIKEIQEAFGKVKGMPCWDLSCSTVGTSLSLQCGKTIKEKGLRGIDIVGECRILVWVDWRLEKDDDAICSSTCTESQIYEGTKILLNQTIESIEIFPPVWDATITFSSGIRLKIFCNSLCEPDTMSNWDFSLDKTLFSFGRGKHIEKEERRWLLGYDCVTDGKIDSKGRIFSNEKITEKEGYEAMLYMLKAYREATDSNNLTDILNGGEYCVAPDVPEDSTFWMYWLEAVEKVKHEGSPPLRQRASDCDG